MEREGQTFLRWDCDELLTPFDRYQLRECYELDLAMSSHPLRWRMQHRQLQLREIVDEIESSVVVWSAGILARKARASRSGSLFALRVQAGKDARAPISASTKPGSLLDANSPAVGEKDHLPL